MVRRWAFLAVVVASVLAFAGTANATPVFLSAINISAAGEDGFEPQVVQDGSGNVHAVWTRSDGAVFRIQYATRTPGGPWSTPINLSDPGESASQPQIDVAPSGDVLVVWSRSDGTALRIQSTYKPSGGSFTTPINISDAGFSANEPQVDFDNSGKAIAVWSRFDGSNLRIQASVRSAGVGGTFANEVTLSEAGQDAFDAQIDAGPNADANSVIVWTRSDGTKLRVQSSRRRDVTGVPRPKTANHVRTALAPAYSACTAPNRMHGPPLAYGSCNPPTRESSTLTIGSPDSNGFAANSASYMRFKVIPGNATTEANEADVQLISTITDVRNNPSGTDYTGKILLRANLQITDQRNAEEMPEWGTTQSLPFVWPVQCNATTDTTRGSNCNATFSANALYPGAVVELKRSMWAIGQTSVLDAGPNGTGFGSCPPTCGDGDETVFLRQAIYIP